MAKTNAKRWKILVKSQNFPATHFECEKAEFTVGRVQSCDLSIRSEAISRHHAKFSSVGGAIYIEDLKSSNGVLLNGARIPASVVTPIMVGDIIAVGSNACTLMVESVEYQERSEAPFRAEAAITNPSVSRELLNSLPQDFEKLEMPKPFVPPPAAPVAERMPFDTSSPLANDASQEEATNPSRQAPPPPAPPLPPGASRAAALPPPLPPSRTGTSPFAAPPPALPPPRVTSLTKPPGPPAAVVAAAQAAAAAAQAAADAATAKAERTNLEALLQKQKHDDELARVRQEIAEAKAQFERQKLADETSLQLRTLEKSRVETELRELVDKQATLKDSFAHNQNVLIQQEEKVHDLSRRLKEQDELIRLRASEIEGVRDLKTQTEAQLESRRAELKQFETAQEAERLRAQTQLQAVNQELAEGTRDRDALLAEAARVLAELEALKLRHEAGEKEYEEARKRRLAETTMLEAEFKLTETRSLTAIEEKKAEALRANRERDQLELDIERLRRERDQQMKEADARRDQQIKDAEARREQSAKSAADWEAATTQLAARRAELKTAEDTLQSLEASRLQTAANLERVQAELKSEELNLDGKRAGIRAERDHLIQSGQREVEELRARIERETTERHLQVDQALTERKAAIELDLADREMRLEARFAQEKTVFLEDARRHAALEKLEAAKLQEKVQRQFDEHCVQERRRIEEEFATRQRNSDEQIKQERLRHDRELTQDLADFRLQKSREAELREKLFFEGILGSFFEAAKTGNLEIPAHMLPDFEARVRTSLKSLYMASDEASLRALEAEQPWVKIGKRISLLERFQRPALYASIGLSAVLMVFMMSGKGGIRDWATAQNELNRKSQETKMAAARAEANRPYETTRDDEYRDSYTDNLLYLDGYLEVVLEDSFRKHWILKVNQFFTKEIPNGDRRAPQFLATESTVLAELVKLRHGINAKHPDAAIKRMRELENVYRDKLMDIAGTQKQWDRVRTLEAEFFDEFRKSKPTQLRAPASEEAPE